MSNLNPKAHSRTTGKPRAASKPKSRAKAAPASPALALPSEITIYTASELHPQWLAWLHAARGPDASDIEVDCQVDGSQVAEVDAAGMQLLLSLARGLEDAQRRMSVLQPSHALVSACHALGMTSLLGMDATFGAGN